MIAGSQGPAWSRQWRDGMQELELSGAGTHDLARSSLSGSQIFYNSLILA